MNSEHFFEIFPTLLCNDDHHALREGKVTFFPRKSCQVQNCQLLLIFARDVHHILQEKCELFLKLWDAILKLILGERIIYQLNCPRFYLLLLRMVKLFL